VAELVVFDTGPLWSFASIGRLDVLETRYGDRARWTLEVQDEVKRNASVAPELAQVMSARWLGSAINVPDLDPPRSVGLLHDINVVRASLARHGDHAKAHLGESSVIVAARELRGWVAIEDEDGARRAEWEGLTVRRTTHVLQECVAMAELTCDEAWRLYEAMQTAGRVLPQLAQQALCFG
jgi:predicted nucleic acid-binding protein